MVKLGTTGPLIPSTVNKLDILLSELSRKDKNKLDTAAPRNGVELGFQGTTDYT